MLYTESFTFFSRSSLFCCWLESASCPEQCLFTKSLETPHSCTHSGQPLYCLSVYPHPLPQPLSQPIVAIPLHPSPPVAIALDAEARLYSCLPTTTLAWCHVQRPRWAASGASLSFRPTGIKRLLAVYCDHSVPVRSLDLLATVSNVWPAQRPLAPAALSPSQHIWTCPSIDWSPSRMH